MSLKARLFAIPFRKGEAVNSKDAVSLGKPDTARVASELVELTSPAPGTAQPLARGWVR